MGTDIHGVFQRFDTGRWVDVPSLYKKDRHYQLFAVLADVRNGYGFAGVPTGEAVVPISRPRGLPADFLVDDDEHEGVCMGDHSYSWLTGEEMLAWAEKAPTVVKTGVISREVYAAWDKVSRPDSYCGAVAGPKIYVVLDDAERMAAAPHYTHVQCVWRSSLKEELAYFFDEVARLQAQYGQIRFVFGFDS